MPERWCSSVLTGKPWWCDIEGERGNTFGSWKGTDEVTHRTIAKGKLSWWLYHMNEHGTITTIQVNSRLTLFTFLQQQGGKRVHTLQEWGCAINQDINIFTDEEKYRYLTLESYLMICAWLSPCGVNFLKLEELQQPIDQLACFATSGRRRGNLEEAASEDGLTQIGTVL